MNDIPEGTFATENDIQDITLEMLEAAYNAGREDQHKGVPAQTGWADFLASFEKN